MSSYAQWFTRFMSNPEVVKESQKIQADKLKNGYDPDLTTTVKGPSIQDRSVVIKERTLQRMAERVYVDNDMPDFFASARTETPEETLDPDKLRCHFCNTPIDKIHATSEVKPKIRIKHETVKDRVTGEVSIVERVSTVQQTIHACPRCCLQIQKPISAQRV